MRPTFELVGRNDTRLWGLTPAERWTRLAAQHAEKLAAGEPILVNLDYVFHGAWLSRVTKELSVVTHAGIPVLARVAPEHRDAVRRAMSEGAPIDARPGLVIIEAADAGEVVDVELRKRERPFLEPLTPATRPALERASYYASYKGVTDLLTKYLWPKWAFALTRLAVRLGLSPNAVTTIGAAFCVLAGVAFWHGWFWSGIAAGLVFMVLDTVDGKLARCTLTASKWGNAFDHGIDLIHPLFWWWAWAEGLPEHGRALSPDTFAAVMIALVAGYVVQRLIEGAFILKFDIHIHVWRRADSTFRLVTARRNPNMVILLAALIAARPDVGIVAVAVWTVISCLFHLVRLAQAWGVDASGRPVESWLA
ncbi:MAG TPA: CDP-alcohol phosphatidyltransferase family protein [Croceibacterium sp.]|nr:CDP-alcohol phosphatidyltransferase family protein [Croceibacterium sp.]